MELGLRGRTVLVLAGSRGLGRAVAEELGREGAAVALCARGEAALAEAAAVVARAGAARVLPQVCDVTDPAALSALIDRVEHDLGPVDCCLVNAGGPPAADFQDLDDAAWESALQANLMTAVRVCRRLLPGMRERGFGRLVQITSVSVREPVPGLVLSNTVRPAAHALFHHLAREAAADGVTLNSVAPGYHATSAVERLVERRIAAGEAPDRAAVLAAWEREIPAGRLGRPEELAALVVFLMSERAGYITGQLVTCDGGWVRAAF